MILGILVPVTEPVNTVTFKTKVETGLANAYDLAFQKQGQARRRKRFVQIGKAGINVRLFICNTGIASDTSLEAMYVMKLVLKADHARTV